MDGQEYSPEYDCSGPVETLAEYSFNAPNGEPEGCEFAESHEEAARAWGEGLQNGSVCLMQVWGPGADARWFRIERLRDGVDARECSK